MVTVDGIVSMAVGNWPWLLLAAISVWYLRWWTEVNRRFLPWASEIGRPPNPLTTLFGAIRIEFDQNRRRAVAILGFVFGGFIVLVNTVGFGLSMFTQLDPITWASLSAAAFGLGGLAGFEPSPTVVAVAIVAAGIAAFALRSGVRRRRRG